MKIDTLASSNRRRRMKAESRQIHQKLAARLNLLTVAPDKSDKTILLPYIGS